MNILAFDTSTDNLSIALKTPKGTFTIGQSEALKHSERLLPLVGQITEWAGIGMNKVNLLVCAKGPGSFTGLRIGIAAAKGIAFALSIPIVSVPTLDFLASGYHFFDGAVLPAIDAKRNRFYTAIYKDGEQISDYMDIEANEIAKLVKNYNKILITGPDSSKLYRELIENRDSSNSTKFIIDPLSKNSKVLECLEAGIQLYEKGIVDSDNSGPIYIRKSDAEEKKDNR